MKTKPSPIAVLCSDLHLSLKPPLARSNEKDWFSVQLRVLDEIRKVAGDLPIICAGDIFDKWNSPAELINFALDCMPHMYAIPGQHDLPFHNYEDMGRSAFGTLISADKITLLNPEDSCVIDAQMEDEPGLYIHAFPWGFEIRPTEKHYDEIHLAVCHRYIWSNNKNSFVGAMSDSYISSFDQALAGYDVALFGDNHLGWTEHNYTKCLIWNNGTLMRRKIDEIRYKPRIGILMSDASIKPHYLDTSKDLFISNSKIEVLREEGFQIKEFVAELSKLGSDALDFREAVEGYLKTYECSKGARNIILQSLENGNS